MNTNNQPPQQVSQKQDEPQSYDTEMQAILGVPDRKAHATSNQLGVPQAPTNQQDPDGGSQNVYYEVVEQQDNFKEDLAVKKTTFKTIPDQFRQSVFELAGDLDLKEFKSLVKPFLGIQKEGERLIDLTDSNDRTLVSQAAFKGNYQVLRYLLGMHKEKKVPVYSEDINGNNALELACIRGYNNTTKERHIHANGYQTNISKRFFVIKLLLGYKEPEPVKKKSQQYEKPKEFHPFKISQAISKKRGVQNRGNNPLHWAMYWNDADLAYLIYTQDISLAFMFNDKLETPFDVPLAVGSSTDFDLKKRSFVRLSHILKISHFLAYLHSFAKDHGGISGVRVRSKACRKILGRRVLVIVVVLL